MKLRKGQIGRSGEVGEWQCEVRWGPRRMVARREQGAVGNVSRGNAAKGMRHHKLKTWKHGRKEERKKGGKRECPVATWVSICSKPPAVRNQRSWVLIR